MARLPAAMIYVAKTAVIAGEVAIGRGSSVWHGTVLRGDLERIVVGEDTNLQDGVLVHVDAGVPAMIGDRVTVGHGAIVHACTIESDCIVGMGSIVGSRARVGSGSILGAGAVVPEDTVIADGSIAMGVPAKVVGPAADFHRLRIEGSWRTYAELAKKSLPARREMKGDPAKRIVLDGTE
jgi:carbonic anhydrase/acetyltransferase-like protein (isoleucine patch superfamily)